MAGVLRLLHQATQPGLVQQVPLPPLHGLPSSAVPCPPHPPPPVPPPAHACSSVDEDC